MILITQSAAQANPEGIRKLAERQEVIVVRDCDYLETLKLLLLMRQSIPPS